MREWLSPSPEPGAWPETPGNGRVLTDNRSCDHVPHVTDVIAVAGDTRRLIHFATGLLAAVLVGAAAVASALLSRGQALTLGSVGLLIPVMLSWLVTAALVLLAEGPVTGAFAELRLRTGAPVDPSAPWSPLGVRPLSDAETTWGFVVPLIAAATRRHARTRLALGAAVVTTTAFLLWMVLSLAAAALT
jgi:hypothetical protein